MNGMTCSFCGLTNVLPKEESSYNRMTNEVVTEAVWICPRCGQKFNGGEISRVKQSDEK